MTDQPPKPPLWRRLLTLRVLSIAALVWLFGSFLWIFVWPRGPIPISRETTFLTEPVGSDGYIDYVTALQPETLLSAQDNAASCYIRAAGLNLYQTAISEEVPQLATSLGLPEVDPSERLIRISEFDPELWTSIDSSQLSDVEKETWKQRLIEQHDRCLAAPWSSDEFPLIAEWLAANQRPLELIVEGASRPGFQFRPRQEGPLFSFLLPLAQEFRNLSRVLTVRAMHRIDSGDLEGAADDINAIYSMARHINEKPFLIELLVGLAIDSTAFSAERALVAQLPTKSAVNHQRQLINVRQPIDQFDESFDTAERYGVLDMLQQIDREARGLLPPGNAMIPGPPLPKYLRRAQSRMIDTTACSQRINDIYTRMSEAVLLPLDERRAAFESIQATFQSLSPPSESQVLAYLSAKNLNDAVIAEIVSGVSPVDNAYRRHTTRSKLLEVACAARLYELANQRPPTKKSDLVPQYLNEWPVSDTDGAPFEEATVEGRWRIFFRFNGNENKPPDEIDPTSCIDIPYAIEAVIPDLD